MRDYYFEIGRPDFWEFSMLRAELQWVENGSYREFLLNYKEPPRLREVAACPQSLKLATTIPPV